MTHPHRSAAEARALRRRAPRVALALALSAGLFGTALPSAAQFPQRRPPGRPQSPLEEQMALSRDQQDRQLFGAMVSRVRVDVIVTDGDGNFVPDLTAADFKVFEDGAEQDILDVQLVDLAAGQVHPLLGDTTPVEVRSGGDAVPRRPDPPVADPDPGGGALAPAADSTVPATAASELGAVIFLIDGPSLSLQSKTRFASAWESLLEDTSSLRVPRGAYMVDNVGRLEELAPLGYDVETIQNAAQVVAESPAIGTNVNRRLVEVARDMQDPDLREIAAAKVRSFEAEERRRTLATYQLLTSFADALWTRSGRTAVIWVSTGVKLMQGSPYTALFAAEAGNGPPLFDLYSPDAQIKAAQDALHRAANGSNVSIYTIDPSLLTETRQASVDTEVGSAVTAGLLSSPIMQQSLDGLRDSMRMAAADTGGKSFIHSTDIGLVLQEIEEDTSRFYLISYAPPNADGDGEYHEIRVEVDRDDTDVRARDGYVAHNADDRIRRLIAAALTLPGSVTDLPVAAQVFTSRAQPGAPSVMLAVAVEGAETGLMIAPDGEFGVSLDVHSLVLDDHGTIDEAHESLNASSSAGLEAIGVSDDNPFGANLVGYLVYRHEWELDPGEYTIHVAIVDNVTGRVGATAVEVQVTEPEDGWSTSDPLLLSVEANGRPQPVVLGRVLPGQDIGAFIEVYGGIQPVLSGSVFRDLPGDDEPPQSARIFPMPMRQAGAGLHRGTVPLPPGMPAGRYIVQLVVTDPAADEHRIVRVPIEVVALPSG